MRIGLFFRKRFIEGIFFSILIGLVVYLAISLWNATSAVFMAVTDNLWLRSLLVFGAILFMGILYDILKKSPVGWVLGRLPTAILGKRNVLYPSPRNPDLYSSGILTAIEDHEFTQMTTGKSLGTHRLAEIMPMTAGPVSLGVISPDYVPVDQVVLSNRLGTGKAEVAHLMTLGGGTSNGSE